MAYFHFIDAHDIPARINDWKRKEKEQTKFFNLLLEKIENQDLKDISGEIVYEKLRDYYK